MADVKRLTDAVERVGAGSSVLDPEVVAQMMGRTRAEGPLDSLTAPERDVLALMAEGRTNRAIASELFLSERAVERHVTSIFRELELPASEEDHRRVLTVLAPARVAAGLAETAARKSARASDPKGVDTTPFRGHHEPEGQGHGSQRS